MYYDSIRKPNYRNKTKNFYGKKSNGYSRFRQIKKLDPNLFIKSAQITELPHEQESLARFVDYSIDEKIKRNIVEHGYTIPTLIQKQSIPPTLS